MLDLETIGVEFDTSGLRRGRDELGRVEGAAHAAATGADKASGAFGKLGGAGNLAAMAVKALGAAFAAYKVGQYASEAAMLAARYETLGVVMRIAGNNAGYTAVQMNAYAKALQAGGISMTQSRNTVIQLATANIDLANASKLARAAQDVAVVGNINSSDALARLVHGIKSGEIEILRTMGLNVSFEASYKKMAAQLGVTSDKLTEQQKVLARTNAALSESAKYSGIYEESMTTAGKAMSSLTRYTEDLQLKVGEAFLPALAQGVFVTTDAFKLMNEELDKAGQRGLIADVGDLLKGVLVTALQTVAVVGINVVHTLSGVGRSIAGVAAMAAAAGRLDFSGVKAIYNAMDEDNVTAEKALAAFEARIFKVGETNKVVAKMTEEDRIKMGAASKAQADADTKAIAAATARADAQKAAAKTYAAAVKSAREFIQSLKDEAQDAGASAEQLKMLSAARAAAKAPTEALRLEIMQQAVATLTANKATEASEKLMKAQKEAVELLAESYRQAREADLARVQQLESGITGMVQANLAIREEIQAIGLTESALVSLSQSRIDDAIATKEQRLAQIKHAEFMSREQIALEREIELLKERRELLGEQGKRTSDQKKIEDTEAARLKAVKDLQTEADKFNEQMNEGLTDSLFRAFEAGNGFLKSLRDSAVAMFKTMILRPVISGVMGPIGNAVSGALGISSGASGAGSILNGVSGASTVAKWLGIGGGAAAATGAAAAGTAGAGVAGALAIEAGAAGGAAAAGGITAALASVPVWGWVAAGALALFGLSGGKPKVQSLGDADITFDASGMPISKKADYTHRTNFNEGSESFVKGLSQQYQTLAGVLGVGTVQTNFGFSQNDEEGGRFRLSGNGFNSGEIGTSDQAIAEATQRVLFAALKSSDLPAYLASAFASVDVQTATMDQIKAAVDGAFALKTFYEQLKNAPFANLRDISDDAFASLLNFSGGVEQLTQNLDTYYENFYSAEEKRRITIDNMVARINANGGTVAAGDFAAGGSLDTRAEYRALVEQTDPGGPLYANLLAMAGMFAELTPEVETLSTATDKLASDAAAAAERLAAVNKGWQDQLDILTGAETDRSIALRDATDDSTRALMAQVWAQQDLAAATAAATAAFRQAQQDQLAGATNAASDAYDGLSRAVAAQQQADTAAYEAQRAIAQASYASQSESLQGQIDSAKLSLDAVGESVRKLSGLSSSLSSTLNSMRAVGTDAQYRSSAQRQISDALATARAGGGLPMNGELTNALATVAKPSEKLFGTFEAYATDFYKTAYDISELSKLTDSQLSEAEIAQALLKDQVDILTEQKRTLKDGFDKQVDMLDAILANARNQLDAANGINTSVLSVADALTVFNQAKGQLEAVRASQVLPTTAGVAEDRNSKIVTYIKSVLADPSLDGAQQANAIAATAKQSGVTEAEIAAAIGYSAADVRQYFAVNKIPQFDVGTNFVPRDMLAVVHRGEKIIPAKYNRDADGVSSGALLAIAVKLEEVAANTRATAGHVAATDRKLARVIRNNALATEAVA